MNHCPECLKFSGRYNMNLECCRIRHLAIVPTWQRSALLTDVKEQQGKDEANRLISLVNAEKARLRQYVARKNSSAAPAPQLF